jgi:hypothetical protein
MLKLVAFGHRMRLCGTFSICLRCPVCRYRRLCESGVVESPGVQDRILLLHLMQRDATRTHSRTMHMAEAPSLVDARRRRRRDEGRAQNSRRTMPRTRATLTMRAPLERHPQSAPRLLIQAPWTLPRTGDRRLSCRA